MRNQDQQFFDSFTVVMGLLVAIGIGLLFVAHAVSKNTVEQYDRQDPLLQAQIDNRIAPLGQVALLGGDALKAAQAAAIAAAAPKTPAKPLTGTEVFHQVCFACHAPPGAGGAPVVGDAAAWDPRIAEGLDTLEQHALHGFTGESGVMPAKGGRPDLSDEEVIAAVKYMVSQDPNAAK